MGAFIACRGLGGIVNSNYVTTIRSLKGIGLLTIQNFYNTGLGLTVV